MCDLYLSSIRFVHPIKITHVLQVDIDLVQGVVGGVKYAGEIARTLFLFNYLGTGKRPPTYSVNLSTGGDESGYSKRTSGAVPDY